MAFGILRRTVCLDFPVGAQYHFKFQFRYAWKYRPRVPRVEVTVVRCLLSHFRNPCIPKQTPTTFTTYMRMKNLSLTTLRTTKYDSTSTHLHHHVQSLPHHTSQRPRLYQLKSSSVAHNQPLSLLFLRTLRKWTNTQPPDPLSPQSQPPS